MIKKLIRKMQTAAGGPLRIKFTPEQIALFESQATRVPGMNNSGGNKYREEGVLALQHLEQEAKRKEEEIKSRMEMRPTLKRRTSTAEKLRGKKDEYELKPQVVGMSGADPLLSFYVGGVGLNGIGTLAKTGLWNVAKYAPATQLGNWGRGYFVGNAFKNSFNGTKDLSKLLAFDLFQELTSAPTSKITRLRPEFSLAMQDKDYVFGRLLWSTNLTKDGHTTSLTKHIKVMDTKQADPLIYVTQSLYPLAIENGGLRATHGGQTRPIWLNSNKPYFGTPTGVSNSTNYTYIIDADKFTPELNLLRSIGGTHYEYPGTGLLSIEGTKRILWDPVLLLYTSTIFTEAPKSKIPSTSLKFFERKPARINEAERAGVPKGERNNVNNSGNLERTVNDIILENEHWLPKETGMFAQKHSSVGSSYRKIFEELWGKENTDRLTDDLLGKLILIRNRLIDTNIPLKGDFVYVVDGQAKAYRNGLEIGYLNNSYIDNGRALHPEMVKKQGTNNAGVSELLYNGTILAENRPIISGSRLLMPEVTTHIWSKYPTRKLISTEGVHAWPLRTAQERGIKLNYEKNWHTLPEFSKLHQLALDENIRTNLTGLPIYELSEPSYLPMVKNARVFDISLLRDGYINLDFTPGFAYKQGGKMNILEFLKNGSGIHIKPENRGKFTKYCHGRVTSECIARGKRSSDPAVRKRATFADNARHFKHKEGGIVVKAANGTKTNLFLKVGNFLNSDLGKTVGTGLVNAFSNWTSSNKLNDAINSLIEALKKQNKADINSIQDWALQKATEEITLKFNELLLLFNSGASFEQPSPVFFEHLELQLANKYAQKAINDANLNSQEAIANLESLKTNPTSDVFSSLVNTGFDYLSNKFANKALDKNGVPSSRNTNVSFYSNPYLKTQNKVGTINSNGSMNTGIGGTTYNWKTNTFGSNNIMNGFDKIKF